MEGEKIINKNTNTMNKITYILTVLVSLSSYAQISVYQHDYPLDYTNTRINNLPNVEYNTFIRLNETEQHAVQTPISKTLKAIDRIQIKPNFKGGPFNGGGLFKATMCDLNRDVVCLSHNELTDIEALKKFENTSNEYVSYIILIIASLLILFTIFFAFKTFKILLKALFNN